MPIVKIKTIHLYDLRRVRPTTLEAICNAKDGDFVPVESAELNSFLTIQVGEGQMERMYEERTKQPMPKKKAGAKKAAAK